MTESGERPDTDLVQSWERGEPVDLKRAHPPTSVVSIRVPNDLLRSLTERARAQNKPTSHVARDLIEDGLRGDGPSTPVELARLFNRWIEEAFEADMAGQDEPVSSFIAGRLAHFGSPAPTIEELGLDGVRKEAFEWQRLRSRTELWESSAILGRRLHQADWVHEIGGLFGIAAELVLVAIEAEVEKQALLRRIDSKGDQWSAIYWRSLRFFTDGQMDYLVKAGHTIANLVLRTFALHPEFDAMSIDRRLSPQSFVPFSDDKEAWVSLSKGVTRTLVRAAQALDVPGLERLGKSLRSFERESAVQQLFKTRGEQYHRWRGESPGVTGIARRESVLARLKGGEAVDMGPDLLPPYEGAETRVREMSEIGRHALGAYCDFMPEFRDGWDVAFRDLTDRG